MENTENVPGPEQSKRPAPPDPAKGGRARASVLTSEEKSDIARKAVQARWAKRDKKLGTASMGLGPDSNPRPLVSSPQIVADMPISMYRGELEIGDLKLECHVLNNGLRVLTQREVVRVLSGGRESGNLQRYLDRLPVETGFSMGPTVSFLSQPAIGIGHDATHLIELADAYLRARELGLLKVSQKKLATQAEIIIRACAKVGIIALIDEATGYDKVKAKRDYQIKMKAFIAEDMQEWAQMFPDSFWFELARLEGIRYSPRNRPIRWGKYIMMFVYDAIDPDVGKWLRTNNPDPHFRKNHHQWLKEFGRDQVHDQIVKVVTIMKLCRDMGEFREKFAHVFKNAPLQMTFDDINWSAVD